MRQIEVDKSKTIVPDWIKKVKRNSKARERYFIKRYGNLDRMYTKDKAFEAKMDEGSWEDELDQIETNPPTPSNG